MSDGNHLCDIDYLLRVLRRGINSEYSLYVSQVSMLIVADG